MSSPAVPEPLKTIAMIVVMAAWVAFVLGGGYLLKERALAAAMARVGKPRGALAKMPDAPEPRDFVRVPVPVPAALPMLGRPGTDAFGYPRDTVDKLGLLALLHAGRYDDLTSYLETLEHESESDFRKELRVADAFDAFSSADPRVEDGVERWVLASPGSFAPLLARANQRIALAWYYRGHEFEAKTAHDRRAKFDDIMDTIAPDLDLAIRFGPKVVYARQLKFAVLGNTISKSEKVAALKDALSICPECFRVRSSYMLHLAPKWGGSYPEMDALAHDAQAHVAKNPLLRALLAYADDDRCLAYLHEEKYPAALDACDHALETADYHRFHASRAYVLKQMKRYDDALAAMEHAVDQAPQNTEYLAQRGELRILTGRLRDGAEDLRMALSLDPASETTSKVVDYSIHPLMRASYDRLQANDVQGCLDTLSLVLMLAPGNTDALARKRYAEQRLAGEGEAARLEAAALSDDADFDAVKKLDDELVQTRQFSRIVRAWDHYLASHESDARAYSERGGARLFAGDYPGALSDLQRACTSGIPSACRGVERVRAKMRQ